VWSAFSPAQPRRASSAWLRPPTPAIWQYATDNGFTIVTKDSDFYERGLIHGFPPKVIWLQCGNTSTEFVANLLVVHQAAIKAFIRDVESACLELY